MSSVILESLPEGRYKDQCVSLPREYGSQGWDDIPEVANIRSAVFSALDALDSREAISARFKARTVIVKPDLLVPFGRSRKGLEASPETTDPRVLDALVLWLSRYAADIAVAESSWRECPSRAAFAAVGVDRLAKRRGCRLIALEEEPCERFFLPYASAMKEVLLPKTFTGVAGGESAFVSVPKMKTSLFADAALGIKNSEAVFPYNFRRRAAGRDLSLALAELLYIIRPDLTLVDGVAGGGGGRAGAIVAGNNVVDTDLATARLMGFDPALIPSLKAAVGLGFCGEKTTLVGEVGRLEFKPADYSLLSDNAAEKFPWLESFSGVGGALRETDYRDADSHSGRAAGKRRRFFGLGRGNNLVFLGACIGTFVVRRKMLRSGLRLDLPFPLLRDGREDAAYPEFDKNSRWEEWPMPPLDSKKELKSLMGSEVDSFAASLRGEFVEAYLPGELWKLLRFVGFILTTSTLSAGVAAIFSRWIPFGPEPWLVAFVSLQIVRGMGVPYAIFAYAMRLHRLKAKAGDVKANKVARLIWNIMVFGFAAWLPLYLEERKKLKAEGGEGESRGARV